MSIFLIRFFILETLILKLDLCGHNDIITTETGGTERLKVEQWKC